MNPWILQLGLTATFASLASLTDIFRRRIPNFLSLACAICGLMLAYLDGGLLSHMLHMVIALALGMLLFGYRLIGGGDAKFYAAIATFFPLKYALQLGVLISLSGVVLLIAVIFTRRLLKSKPASNTDFAKLPYGVAIGLGAVVTALLP